MAKKKAKDVMGWFWATGSVLCPWSFADTEEECTAIAIARFGVNPAKISLYGKPVRVRITPVEAKKKGMVKRGK